MKKYIDKLYSISNKNERNIIGLMSGTSLDGLDIAFCKIRNSGRNTEIKVENFITVPYTPEFRKEVRKIFSVKEGEIELLVLLHAYIGTMHGKIINEVLQKWSLTSQDIDVIASHGQTVYHAPAFLHQRKEYPNATLQIGDGDHIAVETDIITLSDFRMKHIAAGGEGAPLAVYGDYLIFSHSTENRIMLNIGGIANFTWLPNNLNVKEFPSFSTDVGPGNTMMDAYVQKYFPNMSCDIDGILAQKGIVQEDVLKELKSNSFFSKSIPKTIGPELFNLEYLDNVIQKGKISHEDVLATLNKFSADSISDAIITHCPQEKGLVIYCSGGGIHNPVLMAHVKAALPNVEIKPTSSLGIDPDAKEAILFALLANECLCGSGMHIQTNLNGIPDVSMGKICFPK
ncbi:MAG: hypothetical protein RLZZ546_1407 [Bacteroidota bacterium]|jgi:anhydro-N-acetylmuramic acid kinase